MITIIDYGMGNVGSIRNMLKKIGHDSIISSDKEQITNASRLILPGVGAFDKAMEKLDELNMIQIIRDKAASGVPLLGICLGMQLLSNGSEEGVKPGLAIIPGDVKKFRLEQPFKVPHMGWNLVQYKGSPLFKGFDELDEARFYFVHSYHYVCRSEEHSIGKTVYSFPFTSAVQSGNTFGVQFHPEKSHKFGMQLLKNFTEIA